MRRQIERQLGPVDILIANAGGNYAMPSPLESHQRGWLSAFDRLQFDNCITPETILTENNRERIPEAQHAMLAEAHPLRRLGTVEDVAQAVLYLASDNS
jgi:NAD(P)-dependent dehydrogenase (short-subunit alcohol dehydrogenase family)